MKGVEAIRHHVYKPPITSHFQKFGFSYQKNIPIIKYLTFDFRGNFQTILAESKAYFRDCFLTWHTYDKTELVKLSDGG